MLGSIAVFSWSLFSFSNCVSTAIKASVSTTQMRQRFIYPACIHQWGFHCMKIHLAIAVLATACASASFGAQAQVYFDQIEGATGSCQAALPNFEGSIRKRPLALQNEGTGTAFVTCSPQQFLDLFDETFGTRLLFSNTGTAPVSVTCTAVVGSGATATYTPLTVEIAAGGTGALDFDNSTAFTYGSFSCGLPQNAGITRIASYSSAIYTPPAAP